MKDLKLIALRPLKGCNKKFSKVLKDGVPYVLYNDYDFSKYTDEAKTIIKKKDSFLDLYSFTNNFKKNVSVNISAIVGENGSGKSSVVELFYVLCYNISVISEVLFDEDEKRLLNLKDIVPDINVEIFYEMDEKVFLLSLIGSEIKIFHWNNKSFIESKETKFNLNDFFYTISINYSLHSLNSIVLGNWVKRIFHKNDGYQTPIVLNPYRDEGCIDINNEEDLVIYRLLTNILGKIDGKIKPEESLRNVIDRKIAYRLKVEINKEKFKYDEKKTPIFINTQEIGNLILPLVYKYFLNDEKFVPEDTLLNRYAKEYILYKLKNIVLKYQPYKSRFRFFHEDAQSADDYLLMLSKDNSHVTFKLIQAINFLTNELYFKRKESFDLAISYLSTQLDKESKLKDKELITILPPAFFKIDIEFKDADMFSLLSSGEKQRVYSIATLIYQLNNLSSTNSKLVVYKYKRVNVIFDELELYFHPELQRNLVNDIIENLKRVDLKEIYTINILLITHSPFILSDIPDSNILFLTEKGVPETDRNNIKTYGGNIHELLAHSFFLKNGFIGEFAKRRIESIINFLDPDETKEKHDLDPKQVLKEIQIVGEPFLKERLLEMYYSIFDKEKRIAELKELIERLENNDQTT